MKFARPRKVLAAIALFGFTPLCSSGGTGINEHEAKNARRATMEEQDVLQLGEKLRSDVDRAYRAFVDAGRLKNQGSGRNYISEVFEPYIRAGTSFDRAEQILRAAGFEIKPRAPNRFLPEADKYDEIAIIEHYQPTMMGKTSIVVSMRPQRPNDYSAVSQLVAEIVRTMP